MCDNILIVFVNMQSFMDETQGLYCMRSICECHAFIFVLKCQVNALMFMLVYPLDDLIIF